VQQCQFRDELVNKFFAFYEAAYAKEQMEETRLENMRTLYSNRCALALKLGRKGNE
jgi:hypothetical protein